MLSPANEHKHRRHGNPNQRAQRMRQVEHDGHRDAEHDSDETAAPRYAFLNRLLAVGTADIRPEGPVHLIDEIL